MIARRTFLRGCGVGIAAGGISGLGGLVRAQAPSLTPVRSALAAPGLTFAGLYVAQRRGLWEKNGIDHNMKLVQGGAMAMVTLTNDQADFISTASADPIAGWDKGIKVLVIAAFTGALAMQFTARNDWMARIGVGPKSPLEAKVKAFKGARLGVSTAGGGPAQYARYLASTFGIDSDRELKLLAVGFGPARIAALRENQVDVTVGDAPEADQIALDGFGEMFINCAVEVPVYREFPYTVAVVTPDFVAAKPDVVRRIGATLGQANDFIHSNFGDFVDIVKAQFPAVDPRAIDRSLERDKDTFPHGARMNEKMWQNAISAAVATKLIKTAAPAKEGELWTNKFLAPA